MPRDCFTFAVLISCEVEGVSTLHCTLDIGDDLLGAILRTVKGIEVNADTVNFDVIRDTVTGVGHYLGHAQTFARMKTDYVYPEIAERKVSLRVPQEVAAKLKGPVRIRYTEDREIGGGTIATTPFSPGPTSSPVASCSSFTR